MRLLERLKASCPGAWDGYVNHAFVRGIADGTLPEACFRHYLEQDYLFLIHFARAFALAGFRGRTLEDLTRAKEGMAAILDVEIGLHIEYCRKWGIGQDALIQLPEATANMAYTRFVLERGTSGNLLDLHVALAPCLLGYAEIGRTLAADPATKRDGNPYNDWIEMYSGNEYLDAIADAEAYLDRLAGNLSEVRFAELAKTFEAATRLEIGFWQMGLDRSM